MSPSNQEFDGSSNEHSKEKIVSSTSTSKSTSISSSSSTSSSSLNIPQNMAIDCNSGKILSCTGKQTPVLRQSNQSNSMTSIGNPVTLEDRSFPSKYQIGQQQHQQQQQSFQQNLQHQPFQQTLQQQSFQQSFQQHHLDQKLGNIPKSSQNPNSHIFSQNNGISIKQEDIQLFPAQSYPAISNTQRGVLLEQQVQQHQMMQQYPQLQDPNNQLNEFSTFNMIYAKLGDLSDAAIQQYRQVDSAEANSKYYNQTRDSYLNLPIHKGYSGSNSSSAQNDQLDTANVDKIGSTATLNMSNNISGVRTTSAVEGGFNGEQDASTPPLYYAQPYVPSAKFQSVFNENFYNPYSSLQQHDEFVQQKEAFLRKRKSFATQTQQELTDNETNSFNANDGSLQTPRTSILSETEANVKLKGSIPQIFLSNKTVQYSNSSKILPTPLPKDFDSPIFYFEMQFKVQQYIFNALPFRFCKDPTNRSLFVRGSHYAILFEYLNHAYFACAFLDLYHQQVNNGYDDVLNLSEQTYLNMAEYYFARSLDSQARDMTVHEDIKKAVSLVISTILQIIFIGGSPNHNLFSGEVLTVAKNLGLLFTDYALVFKSCDLFNQASARYCLTEFSTSTEIYFPEYLYGLVDVTSPSQTYNFSSSNGQNGSQFSTSPSVSYNPPSTFNKNSTDYSGESIKRETPHILSNEEKNVVFEMVERLKKEFRAIANPSIYHNPYTCVRQVPLDLLISDQQSPITNEKVLEYDMLGTLTRFLVDLPDSFAEMLKNKDPRALIWLAHALMVIASRGYPFWSREVYTKKLEQIEIAMDGYEDARFWKGWLAIPKEMLSNVSF